MKKDWFKYRGYPHIANKVPIKKRWEVKNYVQNRKLVASHSFLPLISKQLVQRRYKRFDSYNSNVRAHYTMKDGKLVPSKKVRTIAYASHLDAHVFAYYNKEILEPRFEEKLTQDDSLNASVIAYRAIPTKQNQGNKNNIHFAKEVFDEIVNRQDCVALLFDIENFFPSLRHDKLKKQWSSILGMKSLPKDHYNLFKAVTKYSFIRLKDLKTYRGHFDEKKLAEIRNGGKDAYFSLVKEFVESDISVFKNPDHTKGIPQGLPISALLANIYMLDFDRAICERLVRDKQVFYKRYSDDMVLICQKDQVKEVKRVVKEEIDGVELTVADEKTEEVVFRRKGLGSSSRLQSYKIINGSEVENMPMNYLGFEFYGYQTLIKSKNLSAFYREMKQTVRRKWRRVEQRKENELVDELPLFKRKIYRLYSYQGTSKRKLISNKGQEGKKERERLFRGNFIRYAHKASEILEAPEIRHQIRNHWKILQKTIGKYEFSNGFNKMN